MNYHNIKHDDIVNGDGLRVTLFISGCDHYCKGCQNHQTWDTDGGIKFDESAKKEIFEELENTYISGITLSGGDPLNQNNLVEVLKLIDEIRLSFPKKTIWLYSGYTWNEVMLSKMPTPPKHNSKEFLNWNLRNEILSKCDVFVDGQFIQELADVNYHWAGSTNQRVIDVQKSLEQNEVVLWNN